MLNFRETSDIYLLASRLANADADFEGHGADASHKSSIFAEAQAEDLLADQQASILVLWADDALRRFARGILNKAPTFNKGYGMKYGCWTELNVPVPLTTLLRATTNTLRHVSEWDDNNALIFPYDDFKTKSKAEVELLTDQQRREESAAKLALGNIKILRRAFGLGVTERIRDVVSWRCLVAIDGYLGTHEPNFQRFEDAVVLAAREMTAEVGPKSTKFLDQSILSGSLSPER